MLKRLFLALAFCFLASAAWAQNPTCPTRPAGDSSNSCASTAFTQTAVKTPPGDVFFGSGRPWVDIRSGANGCPVAVSGASDSQAAIQCQINYLYNSFGGGIVFFSIGSTNGNYSIYSGLTVKGNVTLQGSGENVSNLIAQGDFTALTFDSTVITSAMRDMTVEGTVLSSPTTNLISVASGRQVFFRNCQMIGGLNALQTAGIDGDVQNCLIQGFGATGGGVLSSGGNTYYDAKIDQNVASVQYAFRQVNATDGENRIVNSDMTGNYVHSLEIADTSNTAITSIVNTVIAEPVLITGAGQTMFANVEFGNASFTGSGLVDIVGSSGIGVTVIPSGGTLSCAGNNAIVCAVAFSSLPSCTGGIKGQLSTVTDSNTVTWGANIAGSSTNTVLAYCDGTNWTVAGK